MKLSRILAASLISLVTADNHAESLYSTAIAQLSALPQPEVDNYYADQGLYGNLYIPQYNDEIDDYEPLPPRPKSILSQFWSSGSNSNEISAPIKPSSPPDAVTQALQLLEEAASLDNQHALIALADCYMFGNFSITTNYTRSVEYYHRSVEHSGNGHAYFMLGYIYSSGLFGEIEQDQTRANLYYQFGMENGDIGAAVALGYRHDYGIGADGCEMALLYYSRAANVAMDLFKNDTDEEKELRLSQNIRLVDFNGGIYGKKMSETMISVSSREAMYSSSVEKFEMENIIIGDHEYVDMYYKAMGYYRGDYGAPRNISMAREVLGKCVSSGEKTYGAMNYTAVDEIDAVFLSACQYLLGHIYLRGWGGVDPDVSRAHDLLSNAMQVGRSGSAAVDLGHIYEFGLDNEHAPSPNLTKALELYSVASKLGLASGQLSLVKLLTKLGKVITDEEKLTAFKVMGDAKYSGKVEALHIFADYYERGYNIADPERQQYKCSTNLMYYKYIVAKSERYLSPHLGYAFEELLKGNHKNALLGYSIAAEQGLEKAQISTAYLLYQLQPLRQLHKPKTFSAKRINAAINYLKKAASQKNIDAMILLGDLYLKGVPESKLMKDENKAFDYYNMATNLHSSHGSYKLAYMYEHGYGPVNNSVDYFLAKRYYDLSMQYNKVDTQEKDLLSVKFPISWALVRLRIKHLFGKGSVKSPNTDSNGWLNALKKIGKKNSKDSTDNEKAEPKGKETSKNEKQPDKATSKATAQHEGTDYPEEDEDYFFEDLASGLVVVVLIGSFLLQQYRAFRNRQEQNPNAAQNQEQPGQNQDNPNQPDPLRMQWQFNIGGFRFGFNNIQFEFFAL